MGWSTSYDEVIKVEDIVDTTPPDRLPLRQLQIEIKEALNNSHTDSKLFIRVPITSDDFEVIKQIGEVYQTRRDRTVQCLEPILGVGWEYRVINAQGDNFFVKTDTVKFWFGKRRSLVDFTVFPDHVEECFLDRGYQLSFTFVEAPGNVSRLKDLLNATSL
ncbi:uncharacterized protein LOC124278357 [Haliotis rubra]|uniref:uncharacterized protein LOC124278357 n=1 Tax=Haliotis rubra TaxID=36100 RepID=UPI001EE561C6|nr:uncharacterized protein LOC124278357 [Haliotis rubra]